MGAPVAPVHWSDASFSVGSGGMTRALTSDCSLNPTGPGPSRRLPRMRTGPWYSGTTYHRVLGPNQEGSMDTPLTVATPWVVKGPRGRTGSPRPRANPPNPPDPPVATPFVHGSGTKLYAMVAERRAPWCMAW